MSTDPLLPAGQRLVTRSPPARERGALELPLPFATEAQLLLTWEEHVGCALPPRNALRTWGPHWAGAPNGTQHLGWLHFDGAPMLEASGHETFRCSRFDPVGTQIYEWQALTYDASQGFNASPIIRALPASGSLDAETPRELVLATYHESGSAHRKVVWEARGASRWMLKIQCESYNEQTLVEEFSWTELNFDFFEGTCSVQHCYAPTDLDWK